MELNSRAWQACQDLERRAPELRIARHSLGAASCWDFGVHAEGGLQAGRLLARIGLADLAQVRLVPTPDTPGTGLSIQVTTDHPVAACMASQYAGWRVSHDGFFAMGSGPMRAAAAREPLFQMIPGETADAVVGVLETSSLPPEAAVLEIAQQCHVDPQRLTLLVAPTRSQAGTVQIVARSIETAIHKMLDLDFDLTQLVSGAGLAPLPPVARDDLSAIGRTNDAILYGGQVCLWVRGDDESLEKLVQQLPSRSSPDYGEPFAKTFARYQHDFYKIDPHLFSPAEVRLVNLETGNTFRAGSPDVEILAASFQS